MTASSALSFGELLRRHRRAAGLSQEELAARAGVGVRTISDLERGVAGRPYRGTRAQLVEALGLDDAAHAALAAAGRRRPVVTEDPTAPMAPAEPVVARTLGPVCN